MRKTMVIISAIFGLACVLAFTSAQAFVIITSEKMEKQIITEADLVRTADNFIILFDASSSTNKMVPGKNISRIQAAKNLIRERNEQLPELGYNAGLYIYTGFKAVYDMMPYSRAAFGAAIDKLPEKGSGPTMLQRGLHDLKKVISGLNGKTLVIMFTDGDAPVDSLFKKPKQIAQEISRDYDVCFYLISSADKYTEKEMLKSVSQINACSRVIPMTLYMDIPHYMYGGLFTVQTTSYERLQPTTKVVGVVADDILFDTNSSEIRFEYYEKLDKLGNFLKNNPDAYVVAAGFTDSTGDEEYNLWLSERRVSIVRNYLENKHGISMDRFVSQWYGKLNPIGNNATDEGKQLNRRVEIAVGGIN